MIKIYKASAGSGKTYTLTNVYVDLLLNSPDPLAYRHILAVTFTNKATDEMKQRVLKELRVRAAADNEQGHRAKGVLTRILHDYSNFSITTIDKFMQSVMRSFAREMGQYASYRVELAEDDVVKTAVDRVLDSLDDPANQELLDWIYRFAIDNLRRTGSHNVSAALLDMAGEFLKEDFRLKRRESSQGFVTDREEIESTRQMLLSRMEEFEAEVRKICVQAKKIADDNSLVFEDFKGGKNSGLKSFDKCYESPEIEPSKSFFSMEGNVENWFAKKSPAEARIRAAYSDGLGDLHSKMCALYKDEHRNYCTYCLIESKLYILGIFNELYGSLHEYMRENNIMLLSETSEMLAGIIDGSDTPFIYEKVGTRFNNLMLDEFQDTSVMQWNNFRPLFKNSIDEGHDNLIVGDVKQSIYRWRGSDWNTLDSGIQKDFEESQLDFSLGEHQRNWRSDEVIVNFNSSFFKSCGEILAEEKILAIYDGAEQATCSNGKGYVRVEFIHQEKREDLVKGSLEKMLQAVGELESAGHPLETITVLVRFNEDAGLVARTLIMAGYQVITEESLLISASTKVQQIIALLKSMNDDNDAISERLLKEFGLDLKQIEYDDSSIYSICEALIRNYHGEIEEGEVPYLNSFLDLVSEYSADHGADLAGFIRWWDEVASAKKPISVPDGQRAIRIMTIHKSKGLDLDNVIIPFFSLSLSHSSNNQPYVWCSADLGFSRLSLVPVKHQKAMEHTTFAEDYAKEKLYTEIDAVNLAYVAFTRAKHNLYIFTGEPKKSIHGMGDVLYKYLENIEGEKYIYEFGEIVRYAPAKDGGAAVAEQVPVERFLSVPMNPEGEKRLKLTLRGCDFFDDGHNATADNRSRGIVLHDILSAVSTPEDLPAAVEAMVSSGELPASAAGATLEMLSGMISSVAARGWFSPAKKVYNELSIITPKGEVLRPDRVLVFENEAVVIDYKFGVRSHFHQRQVRRYMDLLSQMGFDEVKGYLWYAAEGEVVEIL